MCTVEFVYNEVQGTLDLISLYASFVIREWNGNVCKCSVCADF